LWLVRAGKFSATERLLRVVLPVSVVLALGSSFMLFYNWRVTGDPLLMPYKLNQKVYGTPTPFYFQPPLEEPPAAKEFKDLEDNFKWQRERYETRWPLSVLASVTVEKLNTLWTYYFRPAMTLPLLFLPLIW